MAFLLFTIIFVLSFCGNSGAHSGRAVLAHTIENVVIDGDWADWPASMAWHEIELRSYGELPRDAQDYGARFRLAYNERANTLYLAVEVVDESLVIDRDAPNSWNTQDGCEIYLDLGHGEGQAVQLAIYGDWRMGEGAEVAVVHEPGRRRYEWRLDVDMLVRGEVQLSSGNTLGLDLVVADRDADGSFSWMAWSRGIRKRVNAAWRCAASHSARRSDSGVVSHAPCRPEVILRQISDP
jgi:hypothetical protein